MMNYSFLLPTRGRPASITRLFESILDTTARVDELEIVLAVDDDDVQAQAISHDRLRIQKVVLPRGTTMGALNQACYDASQGRYVMIMNDDIVLRTKGWDRIIGEVLSAYPDDVAYIHVNDLLFEERLCTFPLVSRKATDVIGEICPLPYRRYKIDDHMYDIYSMLAYVGHRRIHYLPDVIFEHENHVAKEANSVTHGHVFESKTNKVYVPKQEIIEEDDRIFHELFPSRKEAVVRLASLIDEEAGRLDAQAGSRYAARLQELRDPYSYRTGDLVQCTKTAKAPTVPKNGRTTVAVATADMRNPHAVRCLADLKDHTGSHDLIVMDNNRQKGFSHPRMMNQVLEAVDTEYLVLMDDDVYVEPGWLEGLLACMDEETAVVVPMHKDGQGTLNFSGMYLAGDGLGTHEHLTDRPARPRPVQCYCSALVLIDVAKVGQLRMDTEFQKYFFDVVHGLEVWETGYKAVCAPNVVVTHLGGATMIRDTDQARALWRRDGGLFVDKWVRTGRLAKLEEGIWQRFPELRPLCEIPKKIHAFLGTAADLDYAGFTGAVEELVRQAEPYGQFSHLLRTGIGELLPRLYAAGASRQAEYCLRQELVRLNGEEGRSYLSALAENLLLRGKHREAERVARMGLERYEADPCLARDLGLACLQVRNFRDAKDALGIAAQGAPEDAEILVALGTACLELGETREAEGFLRNAQRLLDRMEGRSPAATSLQRKVEIALRDLGAGKGPAIQSSPRRRSGSHQSSPDGNWLVSAIVSTYNAERFMRGCLEDLEAQTIRERIEIVVIDSGSEQNERGIVEEFRRRYRNIVYLRTERENHHAAMNRAIAMARGVYVTMANTDDRHRPDAFERMVAVLEARPEVALVYAESAITDEENATLETARILGHFRPPEFDPRLLFRGCFVGPQPMWRRDVHERQGGFDPAYQICGDYELWLRMAVAERFQRIPEVLGLYFMSPTSNERVNRVRRHQETERARQAHWPAAWGVLPPWDADYNVMATPDRAGRTGSAAAGPATPSLPEDGDDLAMAQRAFRAKDWGQAASAFIRFLARDRQHAGARSGLGLTLLELGAPEEGIAQLREAVRLLPEPDLVNNLACGLMRVGRSAEAERLWGEILKVIPDHPLAVENLARLRSAGTASPPSGSGGASAPQGEFSVLLERAVAAIQTKDWNRAETLLRAVVKGHPECGEARTTLGSVLLVLGRIAEAVRELTAGAECLNTSASWNSLGWALILQGQNEAARAALLRAVERDPSNLDPQRNLATLFENLEMWREAAAAYDLVLLTSPDDPEAQAGKRRCGTHVGAAARNGGAAQRAAEQVLMHV